MKNTKIIYIAFVLVLIQITSFAQFSLKTETSYLNHINGQQRTDLIKNNIANAELLFDKLITQADQASPSESSVFLYELSYSYFLIKEPAQSAHRLLVQRCLFLNDSIAKLSKSLFYESCYQCKLNQSFSDFLWIKSSIENIDDSFEKNMMNLITLSTQMHQKELQRHIIQLGNQMRLMNEEIPGWYEQWEYLVRIGVKEKHIKQVINYEDLEPEIPSISSIKDEKIRAKVYRKSIKHYLRTNSFLHAKNIVVDYQKENQNLFESLDLQIKKMRIWLKW